MKLTMFTFKIQKNYISPSLLRALGDIQIRKKVTPCNKNVGLPTTHVSLSTIFTYTLRSIPSYMIFFIPRIKRSTGLIPIAFMQDSNSGFLSLDSSVVRILAVFYFWRMAVVGRLANHTSPTPKILDCQIKKENRCFYFLFVSYLHINL